MQILEADDKLLNWCFEPIKNTEISTVQFQQLSGLSIKAPVSTAADDTFRSSFIDQRK